jgi:hypothetical protein
MMTGWSPGPGRSVAPASTVSADYAGSSWRLTNVAERANATAIPADVGASMNLVSDGRILVEDGRNYHTGWFTKSADGFDVTPYKQTLVSVDGLDARQLAAVAALSTLVYGNRDNTYPSSPTRNTVISADGARLVVQSGEFRLTFERTGPSPTDWPVLPAASATSR